jgi:hypothetical protein
MSHARLGYVADPTEPAAHIVFISTDRQAGPQPCLIMSAVQQTPRSDFGFAALMTAIDDRLRSHQHVVEYTPSPDCVFRLQITRSGRELSLSDGTQLAPADRVIDLHLWNEQLPRIPNTGPSVSWARNMAQRIEFSLRELGAYLARHRECDDVRAIRADMSLGSARRRNQYLCVMERFGFERTDRNRSGARSWLRRHGENVFIYLLVLAHNPAAVRTDILWSQRTTVYMSRRQLAWRYGARATQFPD